MVGERLFKDVGALIPAGVRQPSYQRQDDLNFEQVGFMLMKFRLFVS